MNSVYQCEHPIRKKDCGEHDVKYMSVLRLTSRAPTSLLMAWLNVIWIPAYLNT